MTFAQTGSIKGTLTDKQMNNEPLPFANVIIKDSSKGTTSDFDGLYTIDDLAPGTYVVEFSFVGYQTIEETIAISKKNYVEIAVKLASDKNFRNSIVDKIKKNKNKLFNDDKPLKFLEEVIRKKLI